MAAAQASNRAPVQAEASVTEHVASIEQAVERNRIASEKLHGSWLGWLRTLSALVIFLSCVQAYGPIMQCWIDEAYAYEQGLAIHLTFQRTVLLAVQDNIDYIMAIMMAICMFMFLNAPVVEFGRLWRAASLCLASIIISTLLRIRSSRVSCLQLIEPSFAPSENPKTRSLPVVIVFHIIASICVGIIKVQNKIHARNIAAVEKLKREILNGKKKK